MSPIYGIIAQVPPPPPEQTLKTLTTSTGNTVSLLAHHIFRYTKTVTSGTPQALSLLKSYTRGKTNTIASAETVSLTATAIVPIKGFRAHKNGTNQTGLTSNAFTQVTFSTESYDVGGYFASSAWTPPAGIVRMMASVYVTATQTNDGFPAFIAIYKDGVIFARSNYAQNSVTTECGPINVVVDDNASGSNVYTVYVNCIGTNLTADGTSAFTNFSGYVFP